MIDIETARQRMGGCPDEDLAAVAGALSYEAPLRLSELITAFEEQDAIAIKRSAHTIKGAASVFNATPVTTPARKIEEAVQNGTLDLVGALIEELKMTVPQLEADLQAFITQTQQESDG